MRKLVYLLFSICALLIVLALLGISLSSCTAASNVNHNLTQAADNFQIARRITVYNARTDLIVMEMEGYMSLSNSETNELIVTCKTGDNKYKKNYVYLNDYVIYVVEDISGTVTDPYHYKVHFYGAMLDVDINN